MKLLLNNKTDEPDWLVYPAAMQTIEAGEYSSASILINGKVFSVKYYRDDFAKIDKINIEELK